MAKITLNPLVGSFASVTALNNLFQLIESEFNNKALYRDNPVGETNTMVSDLDMAFNNLLNLPAPVNDNDPVRLQDLLGLSTPLGSASATLVTISDSGSYFTSDNAEGALQELGAGKVDKTVLASTATGEGASDVGIEDVGGNFTATTVEGALAEIMDVMFPLGSYRFGGGDPNGSLPGTWAQVPEGTFMMATVGGFDPSGGANSQTLTIANMPSHDHGGGNHSHTYPAIYQIGSSSDYRAANIDYAATGYTPPAGAYVERVNNTDDQAVTVTSQGGDTAFENRPKYVGVDVWQRVG